MIESWSDEVDPEILHTLRLLVSEVIGLSVGNEDVDIDAEDGPPVELSMDFDERRVRVEALCVTGRYSFPNALAEVADLSLALIDELSDRWGVCRGDTGTRCWLEIDGWPGAFAFSLR